MSVVWEGRMLIPTNLDLGLGGYANATWPRSAPQFVTTGRRPRSAPRPRSAFLGECCLGSPILGKCQREILFEAPRKVRFWVSVVEIGRMVSQANPDLGLGMSTNAIRPKSAPQIVTTGPRPRSVPRPRSGFLGECCLKSVFLSERCLKSGKQT